MRIYIDESGAFIPGTPATRVCCVAALVVPEAAARLLLPEFEELRATWTDEPEVKGSSLSDDQTAAALKLLGAHDVVAKIVALDTQLHSLDQIAAFQRGQGDAFVAGLTTEYSVASRRWAETSREDWLNLPPQLAAQMYTMFLTLEEILRDIPNYYAQRIPHDLGRFDWFIDPKDLTPARYDQLWQRIVCPVVQTMSIENPAARVGGFDYSAFDRFSKPTPQYLIPHLPPRDRRRPMGMDLAMLLRESVAFPDSRHDAGLQLADIVASAFAKAMNGKLRSGVWPLLGAVMVERAHQSPPVRFVALGPGEALKASERHRAVLRTLQRSCKSMFVSEGRRGPTGV